MLLIRRRPGESIAIGDEVEVRIVDATLSRVTLGIVAPKQVSVRRMELHAVARENLRVSSQVDRVQELAEQIRNRSKNSSQASFSLTDEGE